MKIFKLKSYFKLILFIFKGQTEKTWRIHINDDDIFEDRETFNLRLTDPVSAVLEYPDVAMVTIIDSEDGKFDILTLICYKSPVKWNNDVLNLSPGSSTYVKVISNFVKNIGVYVKNIDFQ